jgi:dTMP kinase
MAGPANRGRLVAVEGGEGAGKTTQVRRLAAWLEERVPELVLTREPGGTPGGEAIRALLLEGAVDRWTPRAELMLLNAARVDHVERLVAPALARGAWVLSDRYVDSSIVYQGCVGGVPPERIEQLHGDILDLPWPDLTILLDIDPEEGMARRTAAGEVTRFERRGMAFHRAVRQGFLRMAAGAPGRVVIVDAAGSIDDVAQRVVAAMVSRLPGLPP